MQNAGTRGGYIDRRAAPYRSPAVAGRVGLPRCNEPPFPNAYLHDSNLYPALFKETPMKTPVFLAVALTAALLGPAVRPLHAAPPPGTLIRDGFKPIKARSLPPSQRVTFSRRTLAALEEAAYLQKFTTEFIYRCNTRAVGCAIAAVGPHGMWSEQGTGAARRAPDASPRTWTANDKITMA